jgi:hypothetical protein
MLPINFEWVWDMSHYVFHGGLWFALSVIGAGMTFCLLKTVWDVSKGKDGDSGHH